MTDTMKRYALALLVVVGGASLTWAVVFGISLLFMWKPVAFFLALGALVIAFFTRIIAREWL